MQLPTLPVAIASAPADGKQWHVNIPDAEPIVVGTTHGLHAVDEPGAERADVVRGLMQPHDLSR